MGAWDTPKGLRKASLGRGRAKLALATRQGVRLGALLGRARLARLRIYAIDSGTVNTSANPSAALLDQLQREGRISPSLAQTALQRSEAAGMSVEEALLESGVPESTLLRHLAEVYGVRYVSTQTLADAALARTATGRLSARLAQLYQAMPLRFSEDDTLTIATAWPADAPTLELVRVAAGARKVLALVARPAAVAAALDLAYLRKEDAFALLLRRAAVGPSVRPAPAGAVENLPIDQLLGARSPAAAVPEPSRLEPPRPPLAPPPLPQPGEALLDSVPVGGPPLDSEPPKTDPLSAERHNLALGDASLLARALLNAQEQTRNELRGHSLRTAQLAYDLSEYLEDPDALAPEAWAVGLFHDLGKTHDPHLTALNVWEQQVCHRAAQEQFDAPRRLLRGSGVAPRVSKALQHLFERFDGGGFPDSLSGESIPLVSRIVALCDSLLDLTCNPLNSAGRILTPHEGCNQLRRQSPGVFDPRLLNHLSHLLEAGKAGL